MASLMSTRRRLETEKDLRIHFPVVKSNGVVWGFCHSRNQIDELILIMIYLDGLLYISHGIVQYGSGEIISQEADWSDLIS